MQSVRFVARRGGNNRLALRALLLYLGIPVVALIFLFAAAIIAFQSFTYSLHIYVFLVASTIIILTLAIIASVVFVRRIVLNPLFHLTQSLVSMNSLDEDYQLFGTERQDEIGDLARTIQYMHHSLRIALYDIQRIEVAEESSRQKSRFLARMSHEIRTPITSVLGIAEIQLQNQSLSPQAQEPYLKIHSAAQTLLGIVNDILDLSVIESGKLAPEAEKYEVANLINDVAHLHLIYLRGKSVKFNLHVDKNLPALLIGDQLRLKQIITNLLSNAFKYTEKGAVDLSVKNSGDHNGMSLLVTIKDTGLGMNEEQLASFSEYTRHHKHRHISGTGLGMPIVFNLLQLMDAEIYFKSEVNVGTTVTLRIPQRIASDESIGEETAMRLQKFKGAAKTAGMHYILTPEPMPYGSVLVADDVDANLYVAKGLLDFYALNVETVNSGNAAIEKIRAGKKYDIVFMDYMMPDLNGFETVKIIRDMGYTGTIIAFTATTLDGIENTFSAEGFDDFISKPIQTKQLHSVLVTYIKDKQPPEVLENVKQNFKSTAQTTIESYQTNTFLQEKLRADFAKKQKNTYAEIIKSLEAGDINNARFLAHTLKGVAGLINEDKLVAAAATLEAALKTGSKATSKEELDTLRQELGSVLEGITPADASDNFGANTPESRNKIRVLFDALHPLIKRGNVGCLDYADELRTLPQTAVLIKQMENFEFKAALATLETLREILL